MEFNKDNIHSFLSSKDLISKIGMLSCDDVIRLFGKDISKMYKFEQKNPHHCYDLFEHTMHTIDSINKSDLNEEEKKDLRIAALFHDVGKPLVAFMKGDTQHFYGHASKSAEIAFPILLEMGFNEAESKKLCFYIKHHDDFIGFRPESEFKGTPSPYNQPITISTVKEQIEKKTNEAKELNEYVPSLGDFSTLMHLCFADASAQSEIVIQNNELIDSRRKKVDRLMQVANVIKKL